ncbi:MAG: UDP-N-acetylglucosamine diphosphorylase/glucosamine-1-phosphate N-acetyltransferase [Acidobacteria bacterium]|nr:UDP-N-acetylglucosamine diphosphorylase/glucosamine-1-phosphate N-acetyltransferase [Acidobacteriota bacterium]NIM63330.1 UDP-N-acetylglucosamine diphosphorylase/glucosamine-1-phosphate N-acetyltransferase [Acidobacteriota bacterium]NIO60514.1 UDP-N-acetylglucosamine diphosphorylase/glucosamine-1-phosphate N-acetyltransferase [Acidobacteriota bacterium]NIQ31634.1 UDP-N-acetylglucosamine diphosphorylase/glucosamine-1-phosphate N-acetyltransferase [Acidobacteriota bacterium]NIQ87121.1 UDP-N-ac
MRSKTIKLLHPVAGRPMVAWVLDAAAALKPAKSVTVVGYQADRVRSALAHSRSSFVLQKEQRGTGHAVLQAARHIGSKPGSLLILNGDLPSLRSATLRKLVATHRRSRSALTVLTAELRDATGYGRILRDGKGRVERIVEHRDASRDERRVREINTGVFVANPAKLFPVLRRLRPDNDQGEYYITDAVHELLDRGERVGAVCHSDAEEVLGVNTRQELARASQMLFDRQAEHLQDRGVTLLDAARIWIDPRAKVGRDTVIYPGVIVEGACRIGAECVIRPGCRIVDSTIGAGTEIKDFSVVLESRVARNAAVGPFAHLRPGSILDDSTKVGNFVEVKKTRLGRGSKASHLTYLGDATIGEGCNIGAGTITCNYDGANKSPTDLGKGVFIGSNTQLVAPLKIGAGAYVAAGSTVTRDVPKGALAIGRSRQKNIEGWVARQSKKRKRAKKKS